ncbi:MAG: hypothetical protein KIT54_00625 [Phycisphaeraceae bacterium]|nr:hypothetical protein [Phycisphaeraceae bacterium]
MSGSIARIAAGGLLIGVVTTGLGCSSKVRNPPQDRFWRNLTQLCGGEFVGRVVADSTDSETFREKTLRLRVGPCDGGRIEMPLLVDGRPWVVLTLTRVDGQLMLKHDHTPGSPAPSGYGGQTKGQGVEGTQEFFADGFTVGLDADAADTVWTIEVRPGSMLSYSLRRVDTPRTFRAVFDLSRLVE